MVSRRTTADGDSRLVMLEPVREYAAERLTARAEDGECGERHSEYYLRLAESTHSPSGRVERLQRYRWLDAEAEADNLRGAGS